MRQKALEKLGETSKRKREKEGGDGKAKKTRKSSSDTIEYLREKSEQEMKRKNDAFFNVMLQQQHSKKQKVWTNKVFLLNKGDWVS